MRYYIEYNENAFDYYGDLVANDGYNLATFSLNGINMDVEIFNEKVVNEIQKIIKESPEYNMYICIPKLVKNIDSKIENYKKVWKSLPSDFPIQCVEKGDEIEFTEDRMRYFASVGKVKNEKLKDVLNFVSKYPYNYFLIMSDKSLLSEISIKNIFDNEDGLINFSDELMNIDALSKRRCNKDDIVLRWRSFGNEHCLGFIFDKNNLLYYKEIIS